MAWRATLHDFELKLPCEGKAAWWALTWLRSIDVPLPQDGQEQLRLLAHELLWNSVEHSGSDEMTLRVEVGSAAVRVIVTDDGTGANLSPREFEPFASSGRGLRWVDHLADEWGIDRNGHTAVWFEMNRCNGKDQAAGPGAAAENS